jgi:quinolinate synthase
VAEQVPEKHFIFNEGCCPIHEQISPEEVQKAKAEHPGAEVLTHPECTEALCRMSDYVGSTSGIIRYAGESSAEEFIVCTENGVRYELEKRYPQKRFYFTQTEPVCRDMKLITLEKVLHVLKTGENEMDVTGNVRKEAKRPLARMLELAGTKQTAGPARG